MQIGKQKINLEKVNFLFNIVSFIAGILFYLHVAKGVKAPATNNQLQDSVLVINTRLQVQLAEIKLQQERLLQSIQAAQLRVHRQDSSIVVVRKELLQTFNKDWERLSATQKEKYVNQLINHLKQQQP